jgi:release factor glutamine methyltransferase
VTRIAALLARATELATVSTTPRLDLELLLCRAADCPRTLLYARPETELSAAAVAAFEALIERRRRGEPMAYILGEREFWSLRLRVSPATLIPRPETELLVELALALVTEPRARVLDLGTGSGAIALALARERPDWRITGSDRSAGALAVAEANRRALALDNVRFREGDWLSGERGHYHLIVANPPYVDPRDPHLAAGDLCFEPREALVASAGGLADLQIITATAPGHLLPGGWLLLEHGADQGAAVRALCAPALEAVRSWRDLAGHERASGGRRPPRTRVHRQGNPDHEN